MNRPPAAPKDVRCRSRRIKGWWLVRCSYRADHAATSKWHCDEACTGWIWYVTDRDRKRPQ